MKCGVGKSGDGSYWYNWNKREVEYHYHLFDIQSPCVKGYLKQLVAKKGLVYVKLSEDMNTSVMTPAPVLNLLLLNTHIMKHVLGHGIGMRQLCDMARAYYYLHSWVDMEELKAIYGKVGIEKWSAMLHAFLNEYLGLDAKYMPDMGEAMEDAGELLSIIMQGGNFGFHHESRGDVNQGKWKRKWETAKAFYAQRNFAAK